MDKIAKKLRFFTQKHRTLSVISLCIALTGVMLLIATGASGFSISIQPESGTKQGVTTLTDSSASNGQAIQFESLASGWNLFWSDEFSGTSVDTSRWKPYHNDYGSGNNELQCHTPNNVSVSGGTAKITTKKEVYSCPTGGTKNYTSAFLGSRETNTYYPLYGKYEMRARLPHGQGLWPGFWLRHVNGASSAEVDILELFHSQAPGKVSQTLHFPNSIGANVAKKATSFETAVNGTGDWHTFAVQIEPASSNDSAVKFTFFVDGNQTFTYTNTNASSWTQNIDKSRAWDIAFQVSAGGKYVGHPEQQLGYLPDINLCSLTYSAPTNGPSSCPTTGIHLANLPSLMEVDYIRVYTWQ